MWTWNWALGQQEDHYAKTEKHLGTAALSRALTQAMNEGVDPISGREIEWLREVPRTSLTQVFNARVLHSGLSDLLPGVEVLTPLV